MEKYRQFEMCCLRFSFSNFYGQYGEGYIEAHHKDKLGNIDTESTETSIDDLVPLCANCHRVIHRCNPMLSIKQLKEAISKKLNR